MKVIVFDLDNTLCDVGKPILPQNVEKLKKLEQAGNKIVLCSGKPYFYLCGLLRQIGLDSPVMIGENGGVIAQGGALPPAVYYEYEPDKKSAATINTLKAALKREFGGRVFFQPNDVGLTVFPYDTALFPDLDRAISGYDLEGFIVYHHVDSIDITPKGVTKYEGLKKAAELLGLSRDDFIAVGDNENDYPMFDFCPESLGIKLKDPSRATKNFDTIGAALDHLLK